MHSTLEVTETTEKHLGWFALITASLSLVWLVLLIYAGSQVWFTESVDQAVEYALTLGWVYYAGYALAAIITVSAMIFFAGIYTYCRPVSPLWATIGFIFVPVYGVLNLTVYVLQITVVPPLLTQYQASGTEPSIHYLIGIFLHGSTGSVAWIVNNLAYSMLGISSCIFGILLGDRNSKLHTAGVVLTLSGIASIIGMVGIVLGIQYVNHGSLVGGVFFLVALVLLIHLFLLTE